MHQTVHAALELESVGFRRFPFWDTKSTYVFTILQKNNNVKLIIHLSNNSTTIWVYIIWNVFFGIFGKGFFPSHIINIFPNFPACFLIPMIFQIWILIVLIYWIWETSRNKLKKHSVNKNWSDLSLFEQIVLVISNILKILSL
jgi:hypothetical protein